VALSAQRLQIVIVQHGASVADRHNVIDQHGRRYATARRTQATQRLTRQMHQTHTPPPAIVPASRRAASPLIVLCRHAHAQIAARAAYASTH